MIKLFIKRFTSQKSIMKSVFKRSQLRNRNITTVLFVKRVTRRKTRITQSSFRIYHASNDSNEYKDFHHSYKNMSWKWTRRYIVHNESQRAAISSKHIINYMRWLLAIIITVSPMHIWYNYILITTPTSRTIYCIWKERSRQISIRTSRLLQISQ